MGESRQRFVEYATAISESLETGAIEYDGELYRQPRAELHPPAFTTFRGADLRLGGVAGVSEDHGDAGVRAHAHPQKPWKVTVEETAAYRELYLEINWIEPPAPVLVNYTTIDADPGLARELHEQYAVGYARSTIDHYEFTNPRLEPRLRPFPRRPADGRDTRGGPRADRRAVEGARRGGSREPPLRGGMPPEVAQRALDTYVDHVLPKLKLVDPFRDICVEVTRPRPAVRQLRAMGRRDDRAVRRTPDRVGEVTWFGGGGVLPTSGLRGLLADRCGVSVLNVPRGPRGPRGPVWTER